MNDDSTGNDGPLSLAERAAKGLLPDSLSIFEIAELELPTAPAVRKALSSAIRAAVAYGDLHAPIKEETIPARLQRRDFLRLPPIEIPAKTISINVIDRESYRAWRAQCPATLLSPLSQIHKWLGATPAVETIPPVEPFLSLPEKRQRQDALSHAISAAIAVLSPSGGPLPQPKVLFEYLRTSDKTKTVIDSSKEQLTWYSAETGRKQTATIANLKRRLDRWKD